MDKISFEDFQKLDLRVGKILSAEKVEGSEKLLKLEVDLGQEKRQILAGISQFYKPEEVVDKNFVFVANLQSRMMMGLESQGMILAADGEEPILVSPIKDVPSGTKLR